MTFLISHWNNFSAAGTPALMLLSTFLPGLGIGVLKGMLFSKWSIFNYFLYNTIRYVKEILSLYCQTKTGRKEGTQWNLKTFYFYKNKEKFFVKNNFYFVIFFQAPCSAEMRKNYPRVMDTRPAMIIEIPGPSKYLKIINRVNTWVYLNVMEWCKDML